MSPAPTKTLPGPAPLGDGRRTVDVGRGPDAVVRVEGLTKRYGPRTAVDGVSFELPLGTVTGFVGPNGAGKTTTMRMLLGLIGISAGTAEIAGVDVGDPGALATVGALIEGPAFYPTLSARRNLAILAALGGIDHRRIDVVLHVVGLADRARDLVRIYSLGMRQRLGIAAALLSDPAIVFLDEPTNGLDPAGIREARALIRQLADSGVTVLVSSHLLAEIEQVCDRLVMIRDGRLVFAGEMHEITTRQRSQLAARSESPHQADEFVEVLAANGYTATLDAGEVRVDALATQAGAVNRLAFETGITLTELRAQREDLETTFFRMLKEEPS